MTEVTSVNGHTGAVVLTATDVEAIPTSAEGKPSGVATLNGSGVLPEAQLPGSVVSGSAAGATAVQPTQFAVGLAPLSATLFIGNATKSDYEGDANIRHQIKAYFGAGYNPLSGRPQASETYAKYFGPTTGEPAQANSSTVIVRNLTQAEAEAGPIEQAQPVTADEGDALLQGRVVTTGAVVSHAVGPQLQNLFGYSPHSKGMIAGIYSRSAVARDAGTIAEQFATVLQENPRAGSGLVRDAYLAKGLNKILTEDAVWVGAFLGRCMLKSEAKSGESSIIVEEQPGAGPLELTAKYAANTQVLVGDTLATREVKTVASVSEAEKKITFTSALSHTHIGGEPIFACSAANIRYESGNLTTDMGFTAKVANFQQVLLSLTSGGSFIRSGYQTATPATPGEKFGIIYVNASGELCYMTHSGVEHKIAGP